MTNLGTTLADLFYPQRIKIAEKKKEVARKTLKDLNDAIARGEADIERDTKSRSVDPNITMQKKQALDSFKEHMYYDKNSPYRQAFITVYGYPPEQSPSMQTAMIRGEEGARMVKLPSRPMLPEEEATREEALTRIPTAKVERQKQGMLGKVYAGEPGAIPSPEAYKALLGGPAYETFASPGLGVVSRPFGEKKLETLAPPYPKEDKTSELLNLLRLSEERRKEEDQEAQMFDAANKAVNETIASLVENKMFSAEEVGGVKGGGIGRIIVNDADLKNQIKNAFDATPYAQKYGMTVDFVEPTAKEKAFLFIPLGKKEYVRIAMVPKGKEGKIEKTSEGEKKPSILKEAEEKARNLLGGFGR